jgi:hypothetical protein
MVFTPQTPAMSSMKDATLIYNGEAVYEIDGYVSGKVAKVLAGLSARALWYGYGALILPIEPEREFQDYVASFGHRSHIVVPKNVNLDKLSILDGINEPEVKEVIARGPVTSFVSSPSLFSMVQEMGGDYAGGDPSDHIHKINDKSLFASFSKQAVATPKGITATGLESITDAIREQLSSKDQVFVRLSHAAGGQGNILIERKTDQPVPDAEAIKLQLMTKDAVDWSNPALVEDYLDIVFSPAVTFNPTGGFQYDNLQITNDGAYRGTWSPVPESVCSSKELAEIGNHFAKELRNIGFQLSANTDLGVTSDGQLVGFEINGRMTASSHAIALGELLLGPWASWRTKHVAIKSLDHFELKQPYTFKELHGQLEDANLLATKSSPLGVVITIPPFKSRHGTAVGLQFHGQGRDGIAYKAAQALYDKTLSLVGNPTLNVYDHPLFK